MMSNQEKSRLDFMAEELETLKKELSEVKALIKDISDVARSVCLAGTPTIGGQPVGRELSGVEPPSLQELRPYKGYY
jgi:hypothetical protein